MRILFLTRRNLTQHPGGDTTQILQTAEALRRIGLTVELSDAETPDLQGFDVAHLFHLDRLWENAAHARRCRRAGVPVVLSTIWWPTDEFDLRGRRGFQGWLARCCGPRRYANLRQWQRGLVHAWERRRGSELPWRPPRFEAAVRALLSDVAVLLPNSRAEQEQIERRFDVARPTVVVPNAADTTVFTPPAENMARAGVLCVGRIEPRKNQHRLIEALRDTDIPLTLAGQAGRYSRSYFDACRRAAGPNVRFVPQQSIEGLRGLYRAAAVHACPSWYETPGLASLEAALCGCALVVTRGGCTEEYFRDQACYTPHDDPHELRAAIESALKRGPVPSLADRVRRDFTWDRAAIQTRTAYELALQR